MTTEGYPEIERFLAEKIGLDPDTLGRKSIVHAVNTAMKAYGKKRVDDYLGMLRSGMESQKDLIERIIIPETWFFRDGESYNYLRVYLGEAGFPGSRKRPLRILSAPCSTGEEPYSIVMTLLDIGYLPEKFHVDAVDISARAIEIARKGLYGKGSFRQKSKEPWERYFSKAEDRLQIDPEISSLVDFQLENLALPSALWNHEPYDIVFCRNLLIYLTPKGRQAVISNINRLLVPNGILFAGNSEVVTFLQYGYHTVKHEMSFACRKTGAPTREQKPVAQRPLPVPSKRNVQVRPVSEKRPVLEEKESREAVPSNGHETALEEIRSLADRGQLQEALRMCEQFLQGARHHPEGYYLRGLISFALDSYVAAEQSFQRVLYLDPSHHDALVHMHLLYSKKGDRDKAEVIRRRIERRAKKMREPERV
ncbi:MAG: hypothetical protein C4576_04800 [Desulfobacteraceae bacterium]|nr:MAG: hypothetical protein C4576_04800 [Desulfobacteraceae bacterium]